jgi:hypothetical protein
MTPPPQPPGGQPAPYGLPWPPPQVSPDPGQPAGYSASLPTQVGSRTVIWLLATLAVLVVLGVIAGAAFLLLNDRTPRETAEAFVNSYADGDCQAGWDLMSVSARQELGDPRAKSAPRSFCDSWKSDPGESFTIVDLVTMTQTGSKATVRVTTRSDANGKETNTVRLVKAGGEWKIDG